MKKTGILVALAFAVLPVLASAQTGTKTAGKITKDTPASLRAEAKVDESAARVTALKQVKNGKVKAFELEREKGHLLYSYDISVAGKTGIQEIQIDAITGSVLSSVHETPKMERKEARQEAKEKAAKKK